MTPSNPRIDPIRIAIPSKGNLYDGTIELLKFAGYKVRRGSDRQYEATIASHDRFHVVFMRPTDIVVQVQEGRCHLGVTGLDLCAEHASEAEHTEVILPDLGYGGCRLVVAVPESWIDVTHMMDLVDLTAEFKAAGKTFRVSTKYPALVRQHFHRWGLYYFQLIDSDGALELHPSLGIADIIVDLTSSGTTLRENRLREIGEGTILRSAAALIGHRPSLVSLCEEGASGSLARLLDSLDGVLRSQGMLHLEVVGISPTPVSDSGRLAAERLRAQGAQHLAWGEIRNEQGLPGWRVTALIPTPSVSICQRTLIELGATRIVGAPTQFVFDRDEPCTFDRLVKCYQSAEVPSHPSNSTRD